MKILIVDDELQMAEILARSLVREGHRALVATSGAEAIGMIEQGEPDCMFLDGLEVLAEVKRRRPALPVVAITGNATPEQVETVRGWAPST